MTIKYNSPVVITFSLVCVVVQGINFFTNDLLVSFLGLRAEFEFSTIFDYLSLMSYTIVHADIDHLLSNLSLILLLGPVLEEKYGSMLLLLAMFVTALITAMFHILWFDEGLIGASGIVFMMIMLISFTNMQGGGIPITFILILFLYIGREVYNVIESDNVSQFAHIIGGMLGSLLGFMSKPNIVTHSPLPVKTPKTTPEPKPEKNSNPTNDFDHFGQ